MQEHFMVLRVLLIAESGRKAQYYIFLSWIGFLYLIKSLLQGKTIHDHCKNSNNI